MKDFIDFCQHRRSTRSFTAASIKQDDIIEVILAGSFAPSLGDLQPWEFVIVQSAEKKQELVSLCGQNEWMNTAPVLIAVIANYSRSRAYHGEDADAACRDSCCAAIQNMLLAAHQLELGSCWVSQFDTQQVQDALGVSGEKEVIALLALGYASSSSELKKDIDPLREFVFFDEYGRSATDGELRLKDYGEAIHNAVSVRKETAKRHVHETKKSSISAYDKFKEQLNSWIDRTKRK